MSRFPIDFDVQRERMVETQLVPRGLTNARVLQAMRDVPRECFVPESLISSCYDDGALQIGHGQTISQPFTVAFMCAALDPQPTDLILEIGTGSAYGAAVLSRLGRHVHTIERIPELAEQAEQRLQQLGYDNVTVHCADGTLGLPEVAPFDGIVVTAGAERLPQSYIDQLADQGRIVIPLGRTPHSQSMFRFTRHGGELAVDNLGGFAFVPLIGEYGWHEPDLPRNRR
jgi:protein-L-isoaspartate(D-aspartate) O-methyltransferase